MNIAPPYAIVIMCRSFLASRAFLLFVSLAVLDSGINGQSINYYNDVQPIFQSKCYNCHAKGKNDFLFNTYSLVRSKASMLSFVIENNIMPPWPADDSYQSYKHSKSLSIEERNIINSWFKNGLVEGNDDNEDTHQLQKRSEGKTVVIKMPSVSLPVNERDTFIVFKIPFSFNRNYLINGIEFSSSVLDYIHHINLFFNENGLGIQNADFIFGYAPGMSQDRFSEGQGFELSTSGMVSGDIHIPPISKSLKLDLKIILKITEVPLEHKLFFIGTRGFEIKNMPNLVIPGDSILEVEGVMPFEKDVILTHIMPHMHLLGKSIIVWGEDKFNNRTPLIRINNWNFRWQNFYEFSKPILIVKGSEIHVKATYDNTVANTNNPNSPPIDVTEGWLASQEMLSVFMLGYNPNER